jgi:DNA (cytosine-5)-methyltransferase 1
MPAGRVEVAFERSISLRLPVHGDAPRTQSWRRWALAQQRPRAVDLFSGCGGLSLGLEHAGYGVILSADNDPWALETHRHNVPGVALDLNLGDRDRIEMLVRLLEGIPIDLLAGGPPCQPFSRAGRAKLRSLVRDGVRSAQDERTELWQSFVEIAERVRPAAVMLENVPDMALGEDLAILRAMTARLESAGYDVHARLLDAWRYGVPQHRQRLVLIALRDGQPFKWPADQKRGVTLRDAIGDLPPLRGGTGRPEMPSRRPTTAFQRRAREGMNGTGVVWDHVTRAVRDDDREAFRLMKPGTRYSDLPEHLRRYRSDIFNDKYNRLSWDDLCRSITAHIAKDGYWYIHPSEQRTLTVREAARIQTFPDRFRFAGSRSHAFRQIGNAVPPALAEAVGREVLEASSRRAVPVAKRDSRRLVEMRDLLLDWAVKDAKAAPWRHPGEPWRVLVGVVLGDRIGARDTAVKEFLNQFPSPAVKTRGAIAREALLREGAMREAFNRLARAARDLANAQNAWGGVQWVKSVGLSSTEEALVRTIGLGEDKVFVSTPVLRVVARVAGSHVAGERQRSDGRMEVGRVIGSGPRAAALTAALHALGRSICTAQDQDCSHCPVARVCKTAP